MRLETRDYGETRDYRETRDDSTAQRWSWTVMDDDYYSVIVGVECDDSIALV